MFNIRSFLAQCGRVWRILRKPDAREYKTTAKVAAIGLAVIGLIGFFISLVMNFFPIF
ncbi:protein translocase SEC61 complex subunit gamma [Candidatus Pacearchaeota archaeon RBG_13_36_9]|nr:MAG: protein translocase SEC61 complex subunit gamma [Candidatus Pacearchaeota archaeon RBG_13_36_9]